jgi:hypothetical protein
MHMKNLKTLLASLLVAGVAWSQAAAPSSPQGVITAKTFLDIGSGTAVTDLTSHPKFPDNPDIVEYPTYFEMYATGDDLVPPPDDVYDNSGGQIVGYFYPDITGEYVFYLASDDASNLYLSPDTNPANKKLIAQEAGWSPVRSYQAIGGAPSTVEAKSSYSFTGTEWPELSGGFAVINLTAGQAYYIEAVFKEGSGGDNLSVSIDSGFPIPGSMLSSFDKASGPATIVTQPVSQTVEEGQPVTFSVEVAGTPPYTFQWKRNGVDIGSPTTSPTLTIDRASRADNDAKFSVTVTGGQGTATSAEATLTVNNDNTPPTLVSARSSALFTELVVTFSEPLDPASAEAAANYQISGGVTVLAAALAATAGTEGDHQVLLTTSPQPEASAFTLTVNNVEDVAGNAIDPDSQAEFRSFMFAFGSVFRNKYNGFVDGVGGNPDNLFADPRYPHTPDRVDLLTMWEYPRNGVGRDSVADPARNYFDTIDGYFIPPTTGNYVFFTSGADRWWLYLSTDENPVNKHMIAAEPGGWTDPRYWLTTRDTDPARHRSDQSEFSTWPTGPTISLTAGQRYYMELVHHDPSWSGGDFYAATYKLAGEADPADGTAPRLTGDVIGAYLDPTGSSIEITQHPADTTQQEGRTAEFTVSAVGVSIYGGTVSYQWQKLGSGETTWVDIAGATGSSYTTPILALADSGDQYRVICMVPAVAEPSTAATLTVVTDLSPPTLAGAGAVPSRTGTTFDVGVSFNELVDSVSAGSIANYALSAGTITGVKYYAGSPGVVLTATGLAVGGSYTVTVSNVKDLAGNAMSSSDRSFSVSEMQWGVVGGNELGLGNAVLTTAEDGFDVYSDGIGQWAAYDETTFVYEEVTGDFDKVVRVEYQDASSQWARAGLVVRDVTNFGVNRTAQEGGAAGRYQKVHVNPVATALGTPGNNSWEGNRRLATGALTTTAGGGGTPLYPNAWCRLQRAGDLFTIFRSDNGADWTQLGTTTFDAPMPATLFVGPEYSPENGNIQGYEGVWLAKFRQYGDYSAVVTPTIGMSPEGVITYTGVLQSSPTVDGQYAPVAAATSPYTVPKTGSAMFYRTSSQ